MKFEGTNFTKSSKVLVVALFPEIEMQIECFIFTGNGSKISQQFHSHLTQSDYLLSEGKKRSFSLVD